MDTTLALLILGVVAIVFFTLPDTLYIVINSKKK